SIHSLSADLADVRQRLEAVEAERAALAAERDYLRLAVGSAQAALDSVRRSRGYQFMRRLGRWGELDRLLAPALPHPPPPPAPPPPPRPGNARPAPLPGDAAPASAAAGGAPRRIAVDLTPLLPGGENGGAKLMTVGLVQHLSRLLPDCELVLLTADVSHDELA